MSNSRNLADLDIGVGGLLPASNMATGAAVSNIGYTPVNIAGATMTGALTATGFTGPLTGNADTATTTTGNAATATNVAYSGLTGTVPTWNQSTTGNAATATNVAYSGLTGTVPTWNQNTTGNAANVTGTVAIANGGTGATTRQAAMDALAGSTTSGQYLRGNGTDVVMAAIVAADVPTLNQNTTGTAAGLSATLAVASGGTGNTTAQAEMNRVAAAVTSGQYLRGNGTNVVMSTIQAADVPTLNQNTSGSAASLSANLPVARLNSGTSASSSTFWRGDGQWASASGGVTSVATGNGLSGGTITTTGTIAIAAPTFDSVGSYTFGRWGGTVSPFNLNSNYAGSSIFSGNSWSYDACAGYSIVNTVTHPGTWKSIGSETINSTSALLWVRVS